MSAVPDPDVSNMSGETLSGVVQSEHVRSIDLPLARNLSVEALNRSNGRRIKSLTVADDFRHKSAEIGVDFGISVSVWPSHLTDLQWTG